MILAARGVLPAAATQEAAPALVGPNAVIQLVHALHDRLGPQTAKEVFFAAGLRPMLDEPPTEMVSEGDVARLFDALFDRLPREQASAVAADAGGRTAAYLLANRIPQPAKFLLALLPRARAAKLLLRAVAANAWTFAGSGRFSHTARAPYAIDIEANPIAMPGCPWHVAVFQGLFRELVCARTEVVHTDCCLAGSPSCRFEIAIGAPLGAGRGAAP